MARNIFGKTWWSRAWLEALTEIDYRNRLPRGRKYAADGAVTKIEVNDGLVQARVRGRRYIPYKITLHLKPFSSADVTKLADILSKDALLTAELSAGKLPEDLPALLTAAGLSLFPGEWQQIKAACSCPDGANPCKHVAAVFYILANEIDKDPFVLFELRGLKRRDLLKMAGFTNSESQAKAFIPLSEATWSTKVPAEFSVAELASRKNAAATLFTLLQEEPVFYGEGNFKSILYQAYQGLAQYIDKVEIPKDSLIPQEAFVRLLWNQEQFAHPLEQITAVIYNSGHKLTNGASTNRTVPMLEEGKLVLKRIKGRVISLKYLLWLFLQSPLLLEGSSEVVFLSAAASVALVLVQTSLFVPEVVASKEGRFIVRYRPRTEDLEVQAVVEQLALMLPPTLGYRGCDHSVLSGQLAAEEVLALYFACLVQDVDELPAWDKLSWVFFGTDVYLPQRFEERQTGQSVAAWLTPLSVAAGRFIPVVRVEVPVGRQKKFRVYLEVEDRHQSLSAIVPLADLYEKRAVFNASSGEVLAQVAKQVAVAAEYAPELKELLAQKGSPLLLSGPTLVQFLSAGQNILAMLGIPILLPKEIRSVVASKLVLAAKTTTHAVSYLSLNEILDFSWEVALDEMRLSKDEFLSLATSAEGVVRYRDQYLLLEPAEVTRLLAQLQKPAPKLSSGQVLRAGLTGETDGALFAMDETLQSIMAEIHSVREISTPTGLQGILRPYQERGFRWLYSNWERGLGSCLADDMGLGKTVQVITLLLKLKEDAKLRPPALVVCPTTLLGNWEKECARFAPQLRIAICHGPDRQLETTKADLILTTYGVVRNDCADFARIRWSLLVIDEAQNIKNADSGQAQALKQLTAAGFVAMSGTPVENRLDELWSIFDFMLPGFLGSRLNFARSFAVPIEKYRDQTRAALLRKATSPFVLRRMKTDRSVITDLPDKIIKNEFCRLTPAQTALYQEVLQQEIAEIADSSGMTRRGRILRLMTWLKQICNHPVHFARKGVVSSAESGKAELAISLLQQIIADGEKALIFTQYRAMGELLVQMIREEIGLTVSFFHGGLQRKTRQRYIDAFQQKDGCPLLVVSLKAGGTGLNLTEATHVLHYDLWWNPAVEDQATDRAYRIGQDKNVTVHRFISLGTLEEKIDAMLTAKKQLAEMTVSAGETWLTEMTNEQLREIFTFQDIER